MLSKKRSLRVPKVRTHTFGHVRAEARHLTCTTIRSITLPPNALSRTLTNTLPNALNVSDPSLGFVFTPGPQTTRVSVTPRSP